MESKRILAPSILSADFTRLGEAVRTVDQSPAQWVHLDIMDGQFVPNISYGFAVVEAARRCTQKTLDAHLMIVEPDRYLSRFAKAGVNPGFGGQKFIETSWGRLQRLVELVRAENPSTLIEVDGGVGVGNAQRLWEAGANALVAGNAVFGAKEPMEAIHTLLQS